MCNFLASSKIIGAGIDTAFRAAAHGRSSNEGANMLDFSPTLWAFFTPRVPLGMVVPLSLSLSLFVFVWK